MLRWVSLTLAIACSLVLLRIGLTAPRRIPLNYNEGWNAYHTASAAAGQPLYPSPAGLILTNYPPISFYIVAAAGKLVGDAMLAGRLLSLLSFLIWTMTLAATARLLRCTWSEAAFAALLFAVNMLVFSDYVGVNDPQILAHAIASLALPVLLREPRTRVSLFACALGFAASIFTKHNLIAVPLACVAWLMLFDRRAAWRLIVYCALLAAAGLGACLALFGPGFLEHLLSPRAYALGKLASMSAVWIPRMAVPLAGLAILLLWLPRDRHAAFGVLLAAIATLVGLAMFGGSGVYWNAMFDAEWALCLTSALALNRLAPPAGPRGHSLRLTMVAGYLAVPLAVVGLTAQIHWGSPRYWLDPRWSEAASAARDVEFLEAHTGPALCEDLALCYWAGKAAEVDFFNMQERIRREPSRADELVRLVESRYFSAAQLDRPGRDLGPRFRDALERNYRVDHDEQWGVFLVPR